MKITQLNEMPVLVDIDSTKMWKKVEKILETENISIDDFEQTNLKDIYLYDAPSASFYIHYTTKDGITAFMFFTQDAIKYKNKIYKVIKQKDTYNIKHIKKQFTLSIFKEMNKKYKRPVLIDSKNSEEMKNVFMKWIENMKKYHITNFFVLDTKTNKVLLDNSELKHDVWEPFERAKRYSIVFDFGNYLKESEYIQKIPNNHKLYFTGKNQLS